MKKIVNIIFIFITSIFILGCETKDTKPLRVAISPWPGYEPLVLGAELGFFENSEIKVVRFPTPAESFRALRNGSVEVAALRVDEVLHYAEIENSPKIFLVLDISNGADCIVAKPEIKSLNDLKNKRVASEGSALGEYLINRALDFSDSVRISDIKLTSIEMGKQEFAYKNGEVDALVTYEPTKTLLLNAGAKVIFDSKQIPNEVIDVLVTNKNIIKFRKKDLSIIVAGWFKTLEYIQKNPDIAYTKMGYYENLSKDEFKKAMMNLIIPSFNENFKLLDDDSSTLIEPVENLANLMHKNGVLKKNIDDIDDFFTKKLLKK